MHPIEKDFSLLLFIAKKSLNSCFHASTSEIALELNSSQQTVSRKLFFLSEKGLIERKVLASGNILSLTEKGKKVLLKRKNELEEVFSLKKQNKISGRVQSGLGEGKYYINLAGYQKQFVEKLGQKVFAGTLNLKIDETKLEGFLSSKEKIQMQGFSTKERKFGSAVLFKVKLNNSVNAALIIPERTNHPSDVVEIISPFFLRKKLKLKDNSNVFIS